MVVDAQDRTVVHVYMALPEEDVKEVIYNALQTLRNLVYNRFINISFFFIMFQITELVLVSEE